MPEAERGFCGAWKRGVLFLCGAGCAGDCNPCTSSVYALDGGGKECAPCPSRGFCPGRNVLIPMAGHWQAQRCSNDATGKLTNDACLKIDKCDSDKACNGPLHDFAAQFATKSAASNATVEWSVPTINVTAGANDTALPLAALNDVGVLSNEAFLQVQCSEGYQGRLCHACSSGWARSGKADCARCDWPMWAVVLFVVFVGVLLSVAYTFMVRAFAILPLRFCGISDGCVP